MRSRTIREGSVGLLLLLGIGGFGVLLLWLGGLTLGEKSYQFVVDFIDAGGMQAGAPVRYRGVTVGQITEINAGPKGVAVTIEIASADLVMPRDVVIETNQSSFIGETSIDITPKPPVTVGANLAKPLEPNCNPNLIICHKSRLQGAVGVSFNELIRSTVDFTNRFSNPIFLENINSVVKNTAAATQGVTQLTQELSTLSQSVRQELKTVSGTTDTFRQTANQIGSSVDRMANQVGVLTNQVGATANQFSGTANQVSASANQLNLLATNLNDLVVNNRSTLLSSLENISQASTELRGSVTSLGPLINQAQRGQFLNNLETLSANALQASVRLRSLSEGQFISNLETASANAAQASASLRELSDPTNIVLLQQTLDSARSTFQNAQKITADLDELTGDPSFRTNVKRLVNGLSGLVSSTEQLQEQAQIAQNLVPLAVAAERSVSATANMALKKQTERFSPRTARDTPEPQKQFDAWGRPSVNGSVAAEPVEREAIP